MTSTTPDRPGDLDAALKALRAGDAEPTDAARADARARLLARIEVEATTSAALRGASGSHRSAGSTWRPAPRRSPVRRRVALGLAAVAITAGAVGMGLGGGGGSSDPTSVDGRGIVSTLARVPDASASEALKAAAVAAMGRPTVAFGPGSSWAVRTTGAELLVGAKGGLGGGGNGADRFAGVLSTTSTRTTAYDGRTTITDRKVGPLRFTSEASENGYEAAGKPVFWSTDTSYPVVFGGEGTRKPFGFGTEQLSYEELLALPTSTAALKQRVDAVSLRTEEDGTVIHEGEQFRRVQTIADLMLRAPLPPQLRAAFWRVAATYDKVKLLGPTADPAGRAGIGITITDVGDRAELIYAPDTGMLLSSWIYRVVPVTTCDRDLAPCGANAPKTDEQGKPWRQLAAAGTVAMGTTVLSAEVVSTK